MIAWQHRQVQAAEASPVSAGDPTMWEGSPPGCGNPAPPPDFFPTKGTTMGIMGVPEAAVSGNASETPDSETGATGNPADPQYPNDTVDEWTEGVLTPSAEAQGLVASTTFTEGQVREAAGRVGEA